MTRQTAYTCLTAALVAAAVPAYVPARAQQSVHANLGGTYRCEPQPSPCPWPGQTMTISQSGATLDLHNAQGSFDTAKLTSDTTISAAPPWNVVGLVLPDHSIQWSDGTQWRKQ